MGRFNIDDILRQLGAPNPNAPIERVPERVSEPAHVASQPIESVSPVPSPAPSSAPLSAPSSAASAVSAVPSAASSDEPGSKSAALPASAAVASAPAPALRSAPPMQWPKGAAPETVVATSSPSARANIAPTHVPTHTPTSASAIDDDGGLSDLYVPDASEDSPATTLEGLLAERGIATAEQLLAAERLRKQAPGRNLVEILKEQGVDERASQAVVAELARMTFESIDPKAPNCFDRALVSSLSAEFCRTHHVLPLRREGGRVVVATASPEDVFLLDEVKRRLSVPAVRHVLATAGDIAGALQQANEAAERSKSEDFDLDSILAGVGDEDEVEVEKEDVNERDFEAEAESSPVVKYVNHIIQVALKEGASDIHIEPDEKVLKVRMRIDGVLFEMLTPPRKMHAALTSRIKIMSNLDIAERRLPQDGRIRATVLGRKLDLRVSTVPTPKGEKTVMRILD
ncbi:MAG: GspE/PulE family protein, partial [bacterium]